MSPWPIGLSTGCFYQRSIFDVLDEIRASGFEQIEVCSFPKHLDYHCAPDVRRAGERMRALALKPLSFHAPFADRIDITSPDTAAREGAVTELFRACDAAAAMGVEHIVLHPGPEREGRPPPPEFLDRMQHAAESLNRVAEHCREIGVHLLLENMLPHLLFGHISDMLYLLGAIRTPDIGACLDTGHAFLAGEIGSVVHKLSGHLQLVHVNDNRGDWDAHLPPGEGGIDWRQVIGDLMRSHFRGALVLELAAGGNETSDVVLRRANAACDYLSQLAAQTGH
jgi:sugar phosphate isomerase/epimerase